MKAVVTGGLGFIGSHLVDLLVSEKFEVLVIDNLETGSIENRNPEAEYLFESFQFAGALDTVEAYAPDYLFHLAALPRIQPSFELPLEHHDVNARGIIQLLTRCSKIGLTAFIYSSSASVYGDSQIFPLTEDSPVNPISPYAIQKYTGERYVDVLGQYFGIPNVSLRYFNPFGDRSYSLNSDQSAYSPVVGVFEHMVIGGGSLKVTGNGLQKRDFVPVEDVARANLLAAQQASTYSGSTYNVCSGNETSILELAKLFGAPIEFLPARPGEATRSLGSNLKISKELGWSPSFTVEDYIERRR